MNCVGYSGPFSLGGQRLDACPQPETWGTFSQLDEWMTDVCHVAAMYAYLCWLHPQTNNLQ